MYTHIMLDMFFFNVVAKLVLYITVITCFVLCFMNSKEKQLNETYPTHRTFIGLIFIYFLFLVF